VAFSQFHVEHVIPKKHDGDDTDSNLALACNRCNLYKGSNLAGIDPASGKLTRLFHPRIDDWNEHFEIRDGVFHALTAVGRVTIAVLGLNEWDRVRLRQELSKQTS
jgi:hypothetical protein